MCVAAHMGTRCKSVFVADNVQYHTYPQATMGLITNHNEIHSASTESGIFIDGIVIAQGEINLFPMSDLTNHLNQRDTKRPN